MILKQFLINTFHDFGRSCEVFLFLIFYFILILKKEILQSWIQTRPPQLVSHCIRAYTILSYVSAPCTLDTISSEVMKTENGRTMTMDRVKAALVQLGCLNQNIVGTPTSLYLMFD